MEGNTMPSWRAIYEDGSTLEQFVAGQEAAKYTDIDRARLRQFIVRGDDGHPILVLHLKPPSKLIYRQRVSQNMTTGEQVRVIIAGWQVNKGGHNFQCVFAVFPDHVEAMDGFDERHPWLYPVKFLPEEKP